VFSLRSEGSLGALVGLDRTLLSGVGTEATTATTTEAATATITETTASTEATTATAVTETTATTAITESTASTEAAAATVTTEASTATTSLSGRREVKSDSTSVNLLTIELHGLLGVRWVCELNVAEAASSAVLSHSDTNLGHSASLAEEVTNGLFLSVESNVTAENSSSNATLSAGSAGLLAVTTWLLSGVLN
jgi:hypothetical protein